MNPKALLTNRRAQIGAGLAVAVILLALIRRSQNGGDPAAVATTPTDQLAEANPYTFADNGAYAAGMGTELVEALGNVTTALDSQQTSNDALAEGLTEQYAALSAAISQATPGASTGQPAASPAPAATVTAAPAVTPYPTPAATSSGPGPWQPAPAPTGPPATQGTGASGAGGGGHTVTLYTRPSGAEWNGPNVFRQDSGPRAGMWYRVARHANGRSYRHYQNGDVVPA